MKNILVIGGSYFAGRVFVEKLLEKGGYNVYVLNRGNMPLRMQGVCEIKCNRQSKEDLGEKLPSHEWHAVVDFCAYTTRDIEYMLAAPGLSQAKQYIFISTTSIYKDSNDLPVKEDAPKLTGPQPELGPMAADYAYNKWLSELELQKQCASRNIAYTMIRPAIIYGKYNYAPRESYFMDVMTQNKTVILPENKLALFTFVSVWDVARAVMACIGNEKAFNNAFNLAGDELVSYRRFVEALEIIMEKSAIINYMSVKAIDDARIPLPFPLDQHLIYSGALIKKFLDFEYTPFMNGMRETYDEYKKNNGLSLLKFRAR